MQLTSTGEAHTGEKCPLCDREHPILTDSMRSRFLKLGFTPEEIEAMAAEQERYAHGYGVPYVPEPTTPRMKPSDSKEARAERKRRSRARQKEAAGG